jgi:phage baseplate assembly protein W
MAVKDISRKPYIVDNDSNIKVGIDLPIRRDDLGDGWFASTKTTIESVKNNIKNLLSTNQGERLMQPTLGLNLKRMLFDPINDEGLIAIQDSILDTFQIWLPFVEVKNIEIFTNENNQQISNNEIRVRITFNIKQDPNTLDSVTVNFFSNIDDSINTSTSGGGGGGY